MLNIKIFPICCYLYDDVDLLGRYLLLHYTAVTLPKEHSPVTKIDSWIVRPGSSRYEQYPGGSEWLWGRNVRGTNRKRLK